MHRRCRSGGRRASDVGRRWPHLRSSDGVTTLELRVTPEREEPDALVPALLPLNAGEQYRFAFAVDACVGCHSCEVACAEQNGLPVGTAWRRVGEIEGGTYPRAARFHLSMACH